MGLVEEAEKKAEKLAYDELPLQDKVKLFFVETWEKVTCSGKRK